MKRKGSKKFIKYPVTTMVTFCVAAFFVVLIVWAYLSEFLGKHQMVNNICGPIIAATVFVPLLLFIFFGNRWLQSESRERDKRFEQKVKAGKKILLMQKRAVAANFLLVLSPIFLLLAVALAPMMVIDGNIWAVATSIPLFALLTVFGVIFSFVTPKEYVRYEDGKIYLFEKPYSPSQIASMEKVYNFKNNDPARAMWFDYRITLDSGKEIYFPKADSALGFEKKIEKIKRLTAEQ